MTARYHYYIDTILLQKKLSEEAASRSVIAIIKDTHEEVGSEKEVGGGEKRFINSCTVVFIFKGMGTSFGSSFLFK